MPDPTLDAQAETRARRRPGNGEAPGRVSGGGRSASPGQIRGVAARNVVWIALAVLAAILAAISPGFRNPVNLQNILSQNAIIGIVACGMLVIMIGGNFDLSVGAAGGAVSITAAALSGKVGIGWAAVAGIGLGVGIALVNGVIVARLRINSFITTFAVSSIVTGILYVLTQAQSVTGSAGALSTIAYRRVAGIPVLFLCFLGFAVITQAFTRMTKWGHWTYAAGANPSASFLSGVPVTAIRIATFAFGGVAVGLAGVLLFGQAGIGQAQNAVNWPLDAIAVCVIGGASLAGGIGRVSNTVGAVLLLGVVSDALNELGVSPYWQPAVSGFVILVAVVADQVVRRGERTS